MHALDPLIQPGSIALLGASERPGSSGRTLAKMVLESGYRGKVYPVNPGYSTILGTRCYPDLRSLPETVEHVALAVSNERLEQTLTDTIEHGAKAATIYSSCVLENDTSPVLKDRLQSMARNAGLAVCGGNGMGFYNIKKQLYAGIFPLPGAMPPGAVTFIAQSGSAFSALAHNGVRLKFNLCVSCGNELTTTIADYIDWSLAQEETRVIGLFLETVRDPGGFVSALERAREKDVPVVMLKVGKSPLGAQMAETHTGAISGNHAAYEALVRKYGVVEVQDFGELTAVLQTFQSPRRATRGELATIQESGGLMELATDIAHALEVPFARIADETKLKIQKYLEPGLKADNPLDAWGSNSDFEERFYGCLTALMKDVNVAVGMFVSNFRDGYYLSEAFYRVVERVSLETDKPLLMTNCHTDLAHPELCHRSRDAGIPFLDGTREGLLAAKHLFAYRDFRQRPADEPMAHPDFENIHKWKQRLSANGDRALSEKDAMELLGDFSISVPRLESVENEAELLPAAERIGYPVVIKTTEPGVNHKSDYGGVVVNIPNAASLTDAYRKLCSSLGPGVLVCEMINPGTEIGLGMINDREFGQVIMVSSGGILIEVMRDRAVALAPVSRKEADEMISTLASDALLRGTRGQIICNRDALVETVVTFSCMCHVLGEHVSEIDINPVVVNQTRAVAVDALVVTR